MAYAELTAAICSTGPAEVDALSIFMPKWLLEHDDKATATAQIWLRVCGMGLPGMHGL